jgi:Uma2 family endonuclease
MTALPSTRRTFTPKEYLLVERSAPYRSELLDGEIYAMAGASKAHNTIVDNLTIEIGTQLKCTPCQGMSQDMKVDTRSGGLYAYPDYVIVYGEQQYADAHEDVLLNPQVVVEVRSPGTESYDRTTKFDRYRSIDSLREYVLVAQDRAGIEHHVLGADGAWESNDIRGLDSSLALVTIDVKVRLADIYDRLRLADANQAANQE